MKTTIRVIASLIALGIGGVSIAMTFSFGMMFAEGADRFIYAGLFALLDAAKFVLPTIAGYLAFHSLKNPARLARFCYLFFALLSASSHVGLTLTVKDTESADAKSAQVRLADATSARDRLQGQIDRLGAVPSSGSIAAEMAKIERDPIFTLENRSAGCTNDTADESRKLCDRWRIVKGQKTDRQKLDALVADLDEAQGKVDRLNTGGTLKKANILASTLADKTGGDEGVILIIIAVLLALGIEAGSSVLLALAAAVGHKPDALAVETEPEPARPAPSDTIIDAESCNIAAEMVPISCPKAWVQERMQPKRGAAMPYDAALDLYRDEAKAEGMEPGSANAFSRALTENGYDRKRQNGKTMIVGAEVRKDEGKARLEIVR